MPEVDLAAIDRALAEKLMGWRMEDCFVLRIWLDRHGAVTGWAESGPDAWQPTRRWDHAGVVMEAMIARGYSSASQFSNAWGWHVVFDTGGVWGAFGPTLPEAISRAALLALEAEK